MDYSTRASRSRRLAILRILAGAGAGRLSSADIMRELDEVWGHRIDRAEVRDELCWLEGEAAVRLAMPGGGVMLAELTQRGQDHLDRRGAPIDGVDLPSRL